MTSIATAADDSISQQLRSTYTCTGATVQGLPTRSLLKSDARYFVRITIDGHEVWTSREIKSKERAVVWDKEEDKREFECALASSVTVTLSKNHSRGRPVEDLGAVTLPLSRWLDAMMIARLVTRSNTQHEPILMQLSVAQKETAVPPSAIALQELVETAESDANAAALRPEIPGLDAASAAVEKISNGMEAASDIADALDGLLSKLDFFITLMDKVSEVHPYTKMAWTILSAALKAAKAQKERDKKMKELIEKMTTVYEFLCDARDLRSDKARMGVLSRLATQTVDCAHFISSCLEKTNFVMRLVAQSVSNVGTKIDEYIKSFDDLLQDFRNGSQLRTEIAMSLVVDDIEDVAIAINLEHIPYAGGAGYEPGRQCLENTRKVLLEKISDWASSPEHDTPNVLVLMGGAGTGKSTIAHTIAHRFRKMKRLGSSFCFSTSASATRKPVNLFRNIARDLANLHPTFKKALLQSVGSDLSLCTTEDLGQQLDKFILEPARALAIGGTVLIVVDALDESGTVKERLKLLRLLFTELHGLPVGLRFLFTCRAEQDIRELIRRSSRSTSLIEMPTLEDDETLSSDILTYICHTLKGNSEAFPEGIDDRSCSQLHYRAEGLFQWAFVACDYIVGESIIGQAEVLRCNQILSGTQGLTGLDPLYAAVLEQILSKNTAALDSFRVMMGFILIAVEPLCMRSLEAMLELLPDKVMVDPKKILPFFGSLLSGVANDTAHVLPLHSSFGEWLQSSVRGGPYYIGESGHHERLLIASLRLLRNRLHFNMAHVESSYVLNRDIQVPSRRIQNVTEDVLYACRHWGNHLSHCAARFEEKDEELGALVRVLLLKNLLFWAEVASVAGVVGDLIVCLNFAMDRLAAIGEDVVMMAQDCIRFIRTLGRAIVDSAAHIYLSALVWLPTESKIAECYGASYTGLARVASGHAVRWPNMNILITGHNRSVNSLAFSPDNRLIVSGSEDNTIRIWNAETGEPVGGPLTGYPDWVNSIAFSPDNRSIVSGSLDETIRLWDAATGDTIGDPPISHVSREVISVAFSPDSRRIVSGSQDSTVRIWDAETGIIIYRLTGNDHQVNAVAFSPDNRRIISASYNDNTQIWDSETGDLISHPVLPHRDVVTSVAISPNNRWIVSGSADNAIRIWNGDTGEPVGEPLKGHTDRITSVAISMDNSRIVSGSWDRTVRTWDMVTRQAISQPLTHSDWVTSVAFSPDNLRIVSGSRDSTIRIWDAEMGDAVSESLTGQSGRVTSLAVSSDNRRIISGYKDNTIRIWDANTGDPVGCPLKGHTGTVISIAFSSDNKRIVSGSYDTTIRIWDAETGCAVGDPLTGHSEAVTSVAISFDNRRIVSGSGDHTLRMWDLGTGEAVHKPLTGHKDTVNTVAFSPDNRCIVSGGEDKYMAIWDTDTGQVVGGPHRFHRSAVESASFSWDSRLIVSGYEDGTILIWDTEANAVRRLTGRTAQITSVAFSPDNRRVISGSYDKTVRIWDSQTGAAIGELTGHSAGVTSVAVFSDNRRIVSGSDDCTIRIWSVDMDTWIPSTEGHQQLSLSPYPEHQLTNSYPSEGTGQVSITFDFETGWIMGNGTDHILWVPPDQLHRLYTPQCPIIIPGGTIHVDLSKFVHGTRWVECRVPAD